MWFVPRQHRESDVCHLLYLLKYEPLSSQSSGFCANVDMSPRRKKLVLLVQEYTSLEKEKGQVLSNAERKAVFC